MFTIIAIYWIKGLKIKERYWLTIFRLIYAIYKMRLISFVGLYHLLYGLIRYGTNLMTLLYFAQKVNRDKIAVVDDNHTLTYSEIYSKSLKLANILKQTYHIESGQRVALLCRNHSYLISSVFAVSGLGAHVYLLNAEMSLPQFNRINERYNFHLLITDESCSPIVSASSFAKEKILTYHEQFDSLHRRLQETPEALHILNRTSNGSIVILTGGTTGEPKSIGHKPALMKYIHPFTAFISKVQLQQYATSYIATPISHGYGLAIMLLCVAMGKKIVITERFTVERACQIIRMHNVEFISVVPLMLNKLLRHNVEDLRSLKCVASGSAELNPKLVHETIRTLGEVLYNLYGTSETGLNCIATPRDLKVVANTVGRPISGVKMKIIDATGESVPLGQIGQLCFMSKGAMFNQRNAWIHTGDMGYCDERGYVYLCGRIDDRIVSAGENVHPIEVEQIILQHPFVEDVAVIGVPDELFGERLRAFIVLAKDASLTSEELKGWLQLRLARYQMPRDFFFVEELPYTPVGKVDKKRLKEWGTKI